MLSTVLQSARVALLARRAQALGTGLQVHLSRVTGELVNCEFLHKLPI